MSTTTENQKTLDRITRVLKKYEEDIPALLILYDHESGFHTYIDKRFDMLLLSAWTTGFMEIREALDLYVRNYIEYTNSLED